MDSRYQCTFCHSLHQSTIPVALAYQSHNNRVAKYNPLDSEDLELPNDQVPIFFVEIDIAHNRQVFDALNLKNAPTLVLVPPKLQIAQPKLGSFLKSIPSINHFNAMSMSIDPNDIVAFIAKHTSVKVDVAPDIHYGTLLLGLLLVISILGGMYIFGQKLSAYHHWRVLIGGGGLIFYIFCISGGMYNSIRGTQWSETLANGQTQYILYQGRDQYGAEGYLMGFSQAACGILVVLMVRHARSSSSSSSSSSEKNKHHQQQSFLSSLQLHSFVGCLGVLAVWYLIIRVYTLKNGVYNHGWLFEMNDWL